MAKVAIQDLIGQKFGRLTIIEYHSSKKVSARCDCGKIKSYSLGNIRRKNNPTMSCGCLKSEGLAHRTHGLRNHPLYKIFHSMKTRCYNSNALHFYLYGGRGVIICSEWLLNPEKFIQWALDKGWRKGLKIDKDILGDGLLYSPETCMIVTDLVSGRNTRKNRKLEFNGEIRCCSEWAEMRGISSATFWYRIKKCNWDMYIYTKKCG